jgi:hypothetical protein
MSIDRRYLLIVNLREGVLIDGKDSEIIIYLRTGLLFTQLISC